MGREDIVEKLTNRCKSVIRNILHDPILSDVTAASSAVTRKFREIGAELLQAKMDVEAERRRKVVPEVCCEGAVQGLVHTREICPTSLFGPVRLRVRTFRCGGCGTHRRPDDTALGVPRSGHFTDDVRELLAPLCAEVPDRTAADLLERTTGVSLSPRGVQGVIRSVAADLRREREAQEVLDERTVSVSLARGSGGPALGIELSMDGVMAHVDGVWREVKVATLLVREIDEAVVVDADKRRGRVLARRLTSVLGGPEELAQRVLSLIRQAGREEIPVVEVLGDGAPWIWNLASIHFPGARQTLDWWHLAEHFHVFAKLRFTDKAGAERWVRGKMGALLADRVGDVLGGLRRMRPRRASGTRGSRALRQEQLLAHPVRGRLALRLRDRLGLRRRCLQTPRAGPLQARRDAVEDQGLQRRTGTARRAPERHARRLPPASCPAGAASAAFAWFDGDFVEIARY